MLNFFLPDGCAVRYGWLPGRGAWMAEYEDEGFIEPPLIEQRLARDGLLVKLDRAFEEGTYCVYVHFNELAARVGYAAARRRAGEYGGLLRTQLDRFAGHSVGETEDAFAVGGMRQRKEEEFHYVAFPVVMADGGFRDEAMKKEFRLAVVRAGQQWEQEQARVDMERQEARRDAFRVRLDALLGSDAYRQLDGATRERLLAEVPALAFPAKGMEL
jgi:hypothetical protein